MESKEILNDDAMNEALVIDQNAIKGTIEKTLTSKKGAEFWKTIFEDSKFAESFAKTLQPEHEKIIKKLMKDPDFFNKIKNLCYIRSGIPETITRREFVDGGECILVFDDTGKKFFKLKGNAWKIWDLLNGETSLGTIVDRLSLDGIENRKTVIRDVCRFVQKIGKLGLIKAALKKSEFESNP